MKILYGTTNNGKLQAMKNALKEFDIELIGLNDLEGALPHIKEDGVTPLENAEIKAKAEMLLKIAISFGGSSKEDAIEELFKAEPFNHYPQLKEIL